MVLEEVHPLGPRAGLTADCRYLGQRIPPSGPLIIGFLVIESPESVNVTAVYTTGGIDGRTSPGIAVEQVHERKTRVVE